MPKLKTESTTPKTAGDMRNSNTMSMLLSFVERHERLQEEVDALSADKKEVREEAKGLGFDTKIIRKVIQRRKMDSATRMETDSLMELYEDAIREAQKKQVAQSEAEAGD